MRRSAEVLFVSAALACCLQGSAGAQSVSSGSTAGTAGSPLAGPSPGTLGSATVANKAAAELDRSGTLNEGRNSGVPNPRDKAPAATRTPK